LYAGDKFQVNEENIKIHLQQTLTFLSNIAPFNFENR
jgi:hypothetical protein